MKAPRAAVPLHPSIQKRARLHRPAASRWTLARSPAARAPTPVVVLTADSELRPTRKKSGAFPPPAVPCPKTACTKNRRLDECPYRRRVDGLNRGRRPHMYYAEWFARLQAGCAHFVDARPVRSPNQFGRSEGHRWSILSQDPDITFPMVKIGKSSAIATPPTTTPMTQIITGSM